MAETTMQAHLTAAERHDHRPDPPVAAAPRPCVLCGGACTRLFVAHGYGIAGCRRCGHRSAELAPADDHVARTYGDTYFDGGGTGYADYLAGEALLRAQGRRYAELLQDHVPLGHVLDVGAAAGFLLQGFLDAGWIGTAVEPNPRMAALARQRLGVPVHVGPLEDFRSSDRFDLVTMIEVLPHFTDVRAALAAAAAVTAPRGYWLIETWNRDDLGARLLGRHWHEYNPPSVLHWFNPAGLRLLLGEYGLVEVAHGHPAKCITGAYVKSILRRQLGGGLLGRMLDAALPDTAAIPYPFRDVFWALFQRAEGR
jgi:SAM-dependent methyltransferase